MNPIKALKAKVVEEINYRSCTFRSVHETTQALLKNGDLIKAAGMTDAEQKKFTGFELELIRLIDELDSPDKRDSDKSFKRENRYTVLKVSDIQEYLTVEETEELIQIEQKINHNRKIAGKEPVEAVVVEHDWPEYEPTWKAIEKRVSECVIAKV